MTEPTNPGDIYVVGQRRAAGGSFPSVGGGSGDHGSGGGTQSNQDTVEQPGLEEPFNPCADLATAKEWNADATAAKAWKEIQRQAADNGGVWTREWGAALRGSGSTVTFQNVTPGPLIGTGSSGTVTPDWTGVPPGEILGWLHTHPGTGAYPSGDDWQAFDEMRIYLAQYFGQDVADQYRIYMVGLDPNGPPGSYKMQVFNHTSPRSSEASAPEVNQQGESCPS